MLSNFLLAPVGFYIQRVLILFNCIAALDLKASPRGKDLPTVQPGNSCPMASSTFQGGNPDACPRHSLPGEPSPPRPSLDSLLPRRPSLALPSCMRQSILGPPPDAEGPPTSLTVWTVQSEEC